MSLPGVIDTSVGYSGGTLDHPTYEDVCRGDTGHTEVVEVTFDPERLPLRELLAAFWRMHDPTYKTKAQYQSVIFTTTPEQQKEAEASRAALGKGVVTEIRPAGPYWRAEDYHQRFYAKKRQAHPGWPARDRHSRA